MAENLSDVYNEDGFDGLLQELTGINAEVIDSYNNDEGIIKVTTGALGMLKDVTRKVPVLVKQILSLQRDLPDVLDVLVEMKYMKRTEANIILEQVNDSIDDLNEIKETAEHTTRSMLADPFMALTHLANGLTQIRETWSVLKERLNLIPKNAKGFMELIGKSVDAHSLKLIVKVLEKENGRLYTKSGDVLINGSTGGKDIKVNLSSAARIYVKGMAIADRKAEIYSDLKTLYQNTYLDDYQSRQKKLIKKFNDMEGNPGHYQYLLGRFSPDTELFYQLTKITVHEQLKCLPQDGFKAAFDNMFAYLEKDIQETKDLLEQIQEAIEKLFDKEKVLAEDMEVST